MRTVFRECRRTGIHLASGLMLNPKIDDVAYLESVPARLRESGLHVPTFVAFEAPIPGTPEFLGPAADGSGELLPDAYLRDFTGYTLVTRPRKESVDDVVRGYVMEPWRVTDGDGRILPQWLHPVTTFDEKGRITPASLSLLG